MQLMEQFGYVGTFLLILIENIFPPIPSEGVLLFGGYLASRSPKTNIWILIVSATLGAVAGAIILYLLGYVLGKERLKRMVSGKIGRVLHLEPDTIERADKWFVKYEKGAVLICRCVPILRSIISIPAGISRMSFPTFLVFTILGSAVWNTILVWSGYFAGDAWKSIENMLGVYSKVVFVVLAVLVVGGWLLIQRRKKKSA